MSSRTFKYRLYPNGRQREKLQATLDVCRELYNKSLQERREAWSSQRKSIHYVAQAKQFGDIKALRDDIRAAHSQVLQDVRRRTDETFESFFLRCKRGQVPGLPRFRPKSGYDSFTDPQAGFKPSGCLSLSKIGDIEIKLHRPVQGEIKTLTIKPENGMRYTRFSCVVESEPVPANDQAVGVDLGLCSFETLRDGTEINNPRLFQKARQRLRRARRRVARREKGSKRWKKAVRTVAEMYRRVFNQCNDSERQLSREMVNNHGLIFVEDLNAKVLSGGLLSKSVHHAGWAAFFQKLSYKAASAVTKVLVRRFSWDEPASPVWRTKPQTAFES